MNQINYRSGRIPWIELGGLIAGLVLCVVGALKHLNKGDVDGPMEPTGLIASNTVVEPVNESVPKTRSLDTGVASVSHPPRIVRTRSGQDVLFYEGSFALVVGISEYTDPNIPDLPGVKKDVERVGDALKLHGFEVTKLLNPSRDELHLAYTEFINENGQDPNQTHNRLFFFYAGHGVNLPGTGGLEQGFLIGRDAPNFMADEQGFRRESYPLRNIHNLAEDILTKHALFVFDSCFSGTLFSQNRSVIPPEVGEMMAQPVRQFITSGGADQKVPDESIFCDLLVDSLVNGTADSVNSPDGYMTGSDLSRYLADEVKKRSGGEQSPLYGKDSRKHLAKGDFVFTLNSDIVKTGSLATVAMSGSSPNQSNFNFSRPVDDGGSESKRGGRPGLEHENSLGMRFRRLNPNHFKIDLVGDNKDAKELKTGRIEIMDAVWLGQYEVTQDTYERILGENSSELKDPLRPVTNVSWVEANNFCTELNEYEKRSGDLPEGMVYRLPWEAEWDLAESGAAGVRRIDDFSGDEWWREVIAGDKLRKAGRGAGNRWGFYDLNENVLEWCGDAFMPGIPTAEQKNPRGPFSADFQLVRGFSSNGASLRIGSFKKFARVPYLGFRVALAPIEPAVFEDVPQDTDFYQLSQLFYETEYQDAKQNLKKFVLEIAQRRLQHHGYLEGKPDGAMGATTQTALNDFQWVNRLIVTGKLGDESLSKLMLVGINEDDVKKGVEAYVKRTGGGGSTGSTGSQASGSSNASDRVAEEITKWSRVKSAAGGGGFGGPRIPFRPF
jgi:hypothetical protein